MADEGEGGERVSNLEEKEKEADDSKKRTKGPPPQPGNKAELIKKPAPPAPTQALENGTLIKGKYKISSKIGQGAFGETYVGENVTDGTSATYAIKIERCNGAAKRDVLKSEVIALKKLQGCPNVVKYIGSGRDDTLQINYLVMERLGNDIAEIRKRTQKQTFELASTIRLGLQMLESIQGVHEQHYIHRDIKPSNFVIGRENPEKVYLIDFGLARRYRSNGVIRAARQAAGFRGTARYASIHSHKQMELGRRDDLWCLFYVLVEFRSESGLPWRRHKEKNVIGEIKERYTNETLVQHLPTAFSLFMRHLFSLTYESEPDYYYLKSLLQSIAEEDNRPGFGQPPKKEARHEAPPANPLARNDAEQAPPPREKEVKEVKEVIEEAQVKEPEPQVKEVKQEPDKDKDATLPTPAGSGLLMSPASPTPTSPRAPPPAPIPAAERAPTPPQLIPEPAHPTVPPVEKEPEVQHAKVGNPRNGALETKPERNDEESSSTPPNGQNMKDAGAPPSEGKERQKCKECCIAM